MKTKILSLLLVSAILMSMSVTALAQDNMIIITTENSEYTEFGGGWAESSLPDAGSAKTRYSNTVGASAEWKPNLQSGNYTVSVFKIVHQTSDKKSKIEVFHANGVESKTIDLSEGSSGWVEIGTFAFNGGTSGYVKMTRVDGYIRTGSVRFARQGGGSSTPQAVKPETFTDISDSRYKESIEFLAQLSAVKGKEGGKFEPLSNMTRAEFASVITFMSGLEGDIKQIPTKFSDLPESHWASGYISAAEGMGIINGFEDGTFKPEESVTYNQAVKMLVSTLGYEIRALNAGEYPSSWINVASNLGILLGTVPMGENPINRETIAKLVDNSLTVDLLVQTGFGNQVKYEAHKGKNILTERLDLLKIEGQITSNYFTSLGGKSSLRFGEVEIGRDRYSAGVTDSAEKLGHYVTAYVTDETDTGSLPVIKAVRYNYGKNITVKVSADQIGEGLTETEFYYFNEISDTRPTNLKISKNADMIYNGRAKIAWSRSDFLIDTGDITFLDSNGDGEIDVIFVRNFKNLIVRSVSDIDHTIYFKDDSPMWSSLTLDPNDRSIKFSLTKADTSMIALGKLKEWDILSVARSVDGEVIEAIVSQDKISGRIEELDNETMIVAGAAYEFAQSFLSDPSFKAPKVDDTADFYLDFEGKVAAIDYNTAENRNYAFLITFEKGTGLGATPMFKMFTEEGVMVFLEAANRIRFNGTVTDNKNVLESSLIRAQDGLPIRQLVTYNKNGDGKLNELNTAVDKTNDTQSEYDSEFTKNATLSSTVFRGGNQRIFSSRYLVREETKLFLIPTKENADDDSLYRVLGLSYFGGDRTYTNLDLYDVTKDARISVIVRETSTYMTNSSPVAIITKVTQGINADGSHVTALYAFSEGKELVLREREEGLKASFRGAVLTDPFRETSVTGATDDNGTPILTDYISVSRLKMGDVIQYSVNQSGELDFSKVLLRGNTPIQSELLGNGTTPSGNEAYSDLYYGYGRVKAKILDGIRFVVPASPVDYERVLILAGAKVYLVEKDIDRVTEITQDDIVENDMVFIRMAGTAAREVVVYR